MHESEATTKSPALRSESWQFGVQALRAVAVLGALAALCGLPMLGARVHASSGAIWGAEPEGTMMRCYGDVIQNRACHFTNLVYDRLHDAFVVVCNNQSATSCDSAPQNRVNNTGFIQLGIEAAIGKRNMEPLKFSFVKGAMPAAADTCIEHRPSILHQVLGGGSFGHIICDNLYPIVNNLAEFGVSDRDYQLLTSKRPHGVFTKYAALVVTRVEAWADSLSACRRRFVLYRDFIAGHGAIVMLHRQPAYAYKRYDPAVFADFKRRALRLAGAREHPAAELPALRVLLNRKAPTDRRRILNIDALMAHLRARFPNVIVEAPLFPALGAFEQVRSLAAASVFVTNAGSAAFRLAFLPPGAHVVYVGAPEPRDPAQGRGEFPFNESHAEKGPFVELGHWSAFQVPVVFHRYRVTERSEYVVPQTDRYGKVGGARDPHFTYWDCDVVLDARKLGDLVATAVYSLMADRDEGHDSDETQTA